LLDKALPKHARGGGILDIVLNDKTNLLPNYFQLHATLIQKKIAWGDKLYQFLFRAICQNTKEEALSYDLSETERDVQCNNGYTL
jgi:hydroxymethylglutaryl-CoA reductase